MRLTIPLCGALAVAALWCTDTAAEPAASLSPSPAPAGATATAEQNKDLLGDMVVVAAATRSLPSIGVVPSLSADIEDVTLRSVVRRDLDLCGEFELLADSAAPDGLYLDDAPVDIKAWSAKGVEAVVRVSAHKSADNVELLGQAFLIKKGQTPVFEKKVTVASSAVRLASHRMADVLIGALTGKNGSFASRMAFVASAERTRRAFVIDADGNAPRAVSSETDLALAPAFGNSEELSYAASKGNAEYRILSESGKETALPLRGSVYGMAYSRDRSKVALSIGSGATIKVYAGADFAHLSPASSAPYAMEPAFTPGGKLAFVGLSSRGQRIYVDDKPATPEGAIAMSPTFCNHPDGVRLVFAAGSGTDTDLFSTGEQGGTIVRLTQNQGKNSAPACSPDGRLVAFFSTRKSGDGPGLYVMRADGLRAKRVSPLMGDSLTWATLPGE